MSRRSANLIAVAAAAAALGTGVAGAAGGQRAGTLDHGFGRNGLATLGAGTRLFAVAVQKNGDAVAAGESGATGPGSTPRLMVVRYTPSGQLDRSFGDGGIVHGPVIRTAHGTGSLARAVAVESDGKIVVAGKTTGTGSVARDGLLVERYDANGRLDTGFGTHGALNLLPGTFGDGYAVAARPGGEIVAAGSDDAAGSGNGVYPRVAVARLTADGTLDRSFGRGGVAVLDLGPYSVARAVALEPSGKIVIAGSQSPNLQATNVLVARLTGSGALDRSFGAIGYYARQDAPAGGAYSAFNAVAVRGNGQIVAAGSATGGNETADAVVTRFTASGHPDPSFGAGGTAYARSASGYMQSTSGAVPGAYGVAITPSGGVIAAGTRTLSVESSLALWDFSAAGHSVGGFGSLGVAQLGFASFSEGAGLAVAPGSGLIVAGDEDQPGRQFAGLVTRYAGAS